MATNNFDLSRPTERFQYLQQKARRYYGRTLGDECYDLAVDTWLHAEQRIECARVSLAAWLCSVLRRQFLTWLRKKRPQLPGNDAIAESADGESDSGVHDFLFEELVERHVANLPLKQQEAMREHMQWDGKAPPHWSDSRRNAYQQARRKLFAVPGISNIAGQYA